VAEETNPVAEETNWTGEMIRDADLPRAFMGLDVEATRELLDKLAASAEESTAVRLRLEAERHELSEQVDALRTVVAELEAALREQARKLESSREHEQRVADLERALEERDQAPAPQASEHELTDLIHNASRTVEEMLAQARSEAERVTAEASREAEHLLEDARSGFSRTQDGIAQLRLLLDETRGGLAESLKAALGTLEPVEPDSTEPRSDGGELVEDLLPMASEPSPFPSGFSSEEELEDHSPADESYGSGHPVFDEPST
jgi:cell division septum initiation protein DivIVA